ncbi:MAG: RHS repeat-associated core domain-containing protein [Deltaproteobacteria bacterium]|nr:RHS repeat-associated core domain-containing protein [Deltaproteobacteria bacterium]
MTDSQGATSSLAPNNTVISTYAYTLDGVGNRTQTDLNEPMMPSYNAETINYTYFLGNILNTADGNTYTHDANGNRTTKTTGTNVTSYTYDSLNRLTQTSTSSRQIQYIYNGLGQRTGKIDNGVQTNYLVDPNGILPQVLAETDASNNLISFYVYDGVGLVAKITPANAYYFYHYDGLGSTVAITDNNGQVVNTYCYSPEGLVGAQETIPNPFTYVGRFGVMAEGNGLYFMRARYYDPETGSFISKDPIGYAGGMNLFTYTENNLVNAVDPWGLFVAVVLESGTKQGTTFGATIIVTSQKGQTVTVSGSSWPSPSNRSPGIASGLYNGVYSPTMLHQSEPGILLSNILYKGDEAYHIPTVGPNPNQKGQYFATSIEQHASYNDFWRGSAGCITVKKSEAQKVWDILEPGETGTVLVIRFTF